MSGLVACAQCISPVRAVGIYGKTCDIFRANIWGRWDRSSSWPPVADETADVADLGQLRLAPSASRKPGTQATRETYKKRARLQALGESKSRRVIVMAIPEEKCSRYRAPFDMQSICRQLCNLGLNTHARTRRRMPVP